MPNHAKVKLIEMIRWTYPKWEPVDKDGKPMLKKRIRKIWRRTWIRVRQKKTRKKRTGQKDAVLEMVKGLPDAIIIKMTTWENHEFRPVDDNGDPMTRDQLIEAYTKEYRSQNPTRYI